MSYQRWARGVRQIGGYAGGTSRLARPPAASSEPDVRPGGAASVAFTKFSGVMFADNFSEAVVTEEGAVNYYRNGLGGVTGFQPICGESRFSAFTVPGTAAGAGLYSGVEAQPYVEWPYFYNRRESPLRTIWKVNLTSAALTQATASPGSGAVQYHAVTSRPEVDYADAIRGITSTVAEIREWVKANEPSAATTQLAPLPSPYSFGHFHLDAEENYWLGGEDGWVVKMDFSGSAIWSSQLPGDVSGSGSAYVSGLYVVDDIGGIAFLEQTDGEMDWFFIDPADGSFVDITADVTIDGVPWDTVALGVGFSGPNVVTTQYGTRVGFKDGADFYVGTVET